MQLISFQTGRPIDVEAVEVPLRGSVSAQLPGGESAVLTSVRTGREEEGQEALSRLKRLATARGQALRRPLAGAIDGPRLLVAAEPPDGASLRTVARMVPLTWDQAAVLGEGLLVALSSLHRLQVAHGAVSLDTVVLCRDGTVRLVDAALPQPLGSEQASVRSDLIEAGFPLAALFSELTPATLRAVPEAVQDRLRQLREQLGSAEGEESAKDISAEWKTAVRHRLDADGKARVVRQLQVLAERLPGAGPATVGIPQAAAASSPAPTGGATALPWAEPAAPAISTAPAAPSPARRWGEAVAVAVPAADQFQPPALPRVAPLAPARPRVETVTLAHSPSEAATAGRRQHSMPNAYPALSPPSPTRSSWWQRRWISAGVGALLLVVAGGGVLVALHPGGSAPGPRGGATARAIVSPSHPPSPTAAPSPTASSTQVPAPVLAPSSDPPVQQVQLVSDCQAPGSTDCQYTVTATLGAHPAVTVSWEVAVVDRCTGSVTEVASGAVAAPGNYTYIEAQPQISVPSGSPVWLVALAGAPNEAASTPIPVTPPASGCGA